MVDYALRFLIGGLVVSLFAVLGDMLRPKSFAGLFGAAASVALATLGLAFSKHGGNYVAIEGRSMILGSIALAAYSFVVCQLLIRAEWVGTQGHPRRSRSLACGRDRPQAIFDRLIAMVVHFKFSALKQGRPHEYVVRFALGGLLTVVAGLVADGAGPEAGGLMLAFPAIFCASATLIEKHERERK
jgi:hypothetical protein